MRPGGVGIAAFYGGAAYVFAIAISTFKFAPLPAAISGARRLSGLCRDLGALIVRTKPLAFMMLTLAVGEMLRHMTSIALFRSVTGGADASSSPLTARCWADRDRFRRSRNVLDHRVVHSVVAGAVAVGGEPLPFRRGVAGHRRE